MVFDPSTIDRFVYSRFTFDEATSEAAFEFSLLGPDAHHDFVERVRFTPPTDSGAVEWDRFRRVIALLGAVLGVSYFKAAAPPTYLIEADELTVEAVDYVRLVLRNGLGEFAYRNGLPGLLDPNVEAPRTVYAVDVWREASGDPLVPIGGGKDSVVSVESLAASGFTPVQFAVNPNVIIRRVAEVSGHPLVEATRMIDRRLLELNAEGALNGHVPVTAMNSLIAVAQSLLLGLGPVVMSNEASASDPTLTWNGEPVNHQWSKSLEAERALAAVLGPQAGLDGAYFSLLRPFSEVRIARGYANTSTYDRAIVSCNRAFRMGAEHVGWCGDCDKCRFVFLAMAPFMPKDRLVRILGKDMFADASQLPGYRALLGLDAHKPFECVGEEAECSVAASLVARNPQWAGEPVIDALAAEIPGLATGSAELEADVLGEVAADVLPGLFEDARRALV
jgi:hypothetical protein